MPLTVTYITLNTCKGNASFGTLEGACRWLEDLQPAFFDALVCGHGLVKGGEGQFKDVEVSSTDLPSHKTGAWDEDRLHKEILNAVYEGANA